jgi:hypothetical protein
MTAQELYQVLNEAGVDYEVAEMHEGVRCLFNRLVTRWADY